MWFYFVPFPILTFFTISLPLFIARFYLQSQSGSGGGGGNAGRGRTRVSVTTGSAAQCSTMLLLPSLGRRSRCLCRSWPSRGDNSWIKSCQFIPISNSWRFHADRRCFSLLPIFDLKFGACIRWIRFHNDEQFPVLHFIFVEAARRLFVETSIDGNDNFSEFAIIFVRVENDTSIDVSFFIPLSPRDGTMEARE